MATVAKIVTVALASIAKIASVAKASAKYVSTIELSSGTALESIGAITGTAEVNYTLTMGAVAPAGATYDIQWMNCATEGGTYDDIVGATSSTYTLTASDATKYIKVKATGNGSYSGTVTSAASAQIADSGFKIEIATTSNNQTFTLPLVRYYNTNQACAYNAVVDWGDGGGTSAVTSYNDGDRVHTYTTAGTYTVQITGTLDGWSFNNAGDKLLLKKILNWGSTNQFVGFKYLKSGFNGCSNLTSLGVGKILASTTGSQDGVELDGFSYTFFDCTGLTSLPVDLFRYNTAVSTYGFYYTFYGCTGLTSLPVDLFRYNTAVSTYGLSRTFQGCTGLTSLPVDLFRYNTAVSTNGFSSTFQGCTKLQLRADIFYAAGEQSTRFLNKSVSFERCFDRLSFSGTQGTAPDLWNCDFGTGTVTKTDCFNSGGNSATSLSNYADIPAAWL